MAATNYMTEVDTESIWDVSLDTTRFGKIGVRIAEILNVWVNGDATTNVTDTAVTPIMEQLSEETLINLINAAKINKFSDVWGFIQANVARIATKVIMDNWILIERVKYLLTKQYHYTETDRYSYTSGDIALIKRTT
jgi:hypothetical protein